MNRSPKARWAAVSVASAVTLLIAALPAAPSQAARDTPHAKPAATAARGKLDPQARAFSAPVLQKATGRAAYFVQLDGTGAAEEAARAGGASKGARAADQRRSSIEGSARSVLASARAADRKAAALFTVTNALPGTGMMLDAAGLAKVAADPRVVKVSRLPTHVTNNANVASLVRAVNAWKYQGNTGRGVRVGIIDTGIDYTHADFGGPGTVAAYQAALAKDTAYNWRSRLGPKGQAKIAGGYDFAGDDYQADPTSPGYQPVPSPDPDPLDCNEHGTHVAGSVGGYGVGANGKTYSGGYSTLSKAKLLQMDVGPGMAPRAELYGLRIFGCTGSTNLVIPALDFALDPNGDGKFDDHLDLINMSLGSSFAPVDNPENDVVDSLAKHGVLSVVSMGNSGDLTDAGGEPGSAVSSLAVASSVDALQQRDGLKVNAPAGVKGIAAGQMSVAYDWPGNGPTGQPVTGAVVTVGSVADIPATNADGCDPFTPAQVTAVTGKVAWLEWDDDDATRRCGSVGRAANAFAAGAVGAIFTSGLDVFGAGITGSADIPVFQIPQAQTTRLRPAATSGALNVTFDGALQATIKDVTNSITDTVSDFSSRGPHGSFGVVKPDVTAVGDTVSSASVGTGNKVLTISGTSMAAPVTAGTAALVKAAHPGWGPLRLKAAIMNTATHDLYTGAGRTGLKYAPARVGAGRIDAASATSTDVLAYVSTGTGVSASFGVVAAPIDGGTITRTKNVTVTNLKAKKRVFKARYQGINPLAGVSYKVSPKSFTLKPKGTRKIKVTMTVVPTALRHKMDPTMDAEQANVYYGEDEARQFVADSSGRLLVNPVGKPAIRVPVYGAAKPSSTTTTALSGNDLVLSGTGFDTGNRSTDYTSLVSVLELGTTSPRLPACADPDAVPTGCASRFADKGADLQYVGAAATADTLTFGLSTYGDWPNLGTAVIPYVDYDVDGDDDPDFETYLQNIEGTDLLFAWTISLSDGSLLDLEPVNLNLGDVDTNVFDSRVVTMTVFKEALGVPVGDISYRVGMHSAVTDTEIDGTDLVDFDAATPTVSTADPLYRDAGNTGITLTGTRLEDAQALVLHLHGRPGRQAELVAVPGTPPVRP